MTIASLLGVPAIYRWSQRLIAGDFRTIYASQFIRAKPGDRILDLGCGTADILEHLPEVDYFGIDMSAHYIRAATRRYGNRGLFRCQSFRGIDLDEIPPMDLVLFNGVFHHLNDREMLDALKVAKQALRSGGRLVSHDGCYREGQAPLARYLLQHDRGQYVRTAEGYMNLVSQVFFDIKSTIRHDLLRVSYTHLILECAA
jgi:SAM-dependent methyltransferase